MKNTKHIFLLLNISLFLLFLSTTSCDRCADKDCFTPPTNYQFRIMDTINGSDLVYNDIFEERYVKIFSNDGSTVSHDFIKDTLRQRTLINTGAFWEVDPSKSIFEIRINTDTGEIVIPFQVLQKEMNENCCTFYQMETFEVSRYKSKLFDNYYCEIYLKNPL